MAVAGPSWPTPIVPPVDEGEWALLHPMKTSLVALIPGAAQGATTVVLGHPLDTAKVRMQSGGPHTCRSTVGTMWSMATAEGPSSLYRGVAPPLLMEGIKRSVQFALWDWMRAFARDASASRNGADGAARGGAGGAWEAVRDCAHCGLVGIGSNSFVCGAVAGGVGTLIGCPMHVIKIQTQCQTAMGTRNAWTCTRSIYDREGIFGFYRGFRCNVAKDVCFAGMYLGLYAVLREHPVFEPPSASTTAETTTTTTRPSRKTNMCAFLSGAVASMATWGLLFPLDTIKTLVQARQAHAVLSVLRQPALLYRGLAASLIKAGPVSGVAMAVYEQTWAFVNKRPTLR
ncbi:putative mitochondrial carrier protein [Leishmania infantum JPCM5]|uniref:Mitochondrial_carrier_protein_-__putative n=2 Tax=Leishmania infantum TaxID=5671 RepID=A0A6L0WTX6_LEIIN|nr:putative mitochondrial carrier protein [Leishmania infantum JPCM5]CAC9455368.1 mitochondrial_carrier_protein_-__putative [Leishmania infantum]CAM65955.1 putative mitochondrial carrier protein [Leishmania infantum JPCM5]SUZ39585.1 mitochondrial_carrier_protein_-__putative [Leishmania infantum]|eukprot:XP_001463590.1 putative mitochondrial carrier protein [Leishmania infantum JPCM5]